MPKTSSCLFLVGLLTLTGCDSSNVTRDVVRDLSLSWTTASPPEVDLNQTVVDQAIADAEAIPRFRTLLVVRNGRLAVEEYFHGASQDQLQDVRSVTKSVVGILTGIAIDQGHISLETRVVDLLNNIADVPSQHANITVRDLLTMSGGFEWNETGGPEYNQWLTSSDHIQYLLDKPQENIPGTTFTYNSAAVHLLGVMLEEAIGQPLPEYADDVLFEPLGISTRIWETTTGAYVNGGSGIDLRGRDLARLGQLFLQNGQSGDDQIVPTSWVQASTAPQYSWRSGIGPVSSYTYAQLWWVDDSSSNVAYYAWGYGGQFIYIVPSLDLVVVATTDWRGVSGDGGATSMEAATLDVIVDGIVAAAR